uniref:START domain-containing protein n=1 Tax=Guillardia theta TaxID=55529 RepID=A0A6U5XTI1_GUITH|mmetsp:Transcript_1903/g.5729  ORF Transcript_1903/g.5729 Transcript_1903/m.5729 type:complete len:838 (+) Transcript_1903:106-2619(+)
MISHRCLLGCFLFCVVCLRTTRQEQIPSLTAKTLPHERKTSALVHLMNKKSSFARTRNDWNMKNGEDVNREIERYSKIAASGFNAYEEDRKHEKHRITDRHKLQEVDAKKAASSLLSQYRKIASAGISVQGSQIQTSRPGKLTSIEVLSPTGHWRPVTVNQFERGRVLVHYKGFDHSYDEWINAMSPRIRLQSLGSEQAHSDLRSDRHGPSREQGKTRVRGRMVETQLDRMSHVETKSTMRTNETNPAVDPEFVKIYKDLRLAARDAKSHGLTDIENQIELEEAKLIKLSELPGKLPTSVMAQLTKAVNVLQQRLRHRVQALREGSISRTNHPTAPKITHQVVLSKTDAKANALKRMVMRFSKGAIALASKSRSKIPMHKQLASRIDKSVLSRENAVGYTPKISEEFSSCLIPSIPATMSPSFANRKVLSFALMSKYVPSDSPKMHLKVTGTALDGTAGDDYGEIILGLDRRADGAAWYYDSQIIVSSSPWSMVGFLEDEPDMLVSDCHDRFLSVINMKPYTYQTQQHGMKTVASIVLDHGADPLFVTRHKTFNVDDVQRPDSSYFVWSHQNQPLAILQQSGSDDGSKWVIQILQGSPLDFRVIGLLAAQIEAEKFFLHSTSFFELGSAFVIALNVLLVCCCMPSLFRWCKGTQSASADKQSVMHGSLMEASEHRMQHLSIPGLRGDSFQEYQQDSSKVISGNVHADSKALSTSSLLRNHAAGPGKGDCSVEPDGYLPPPSMPIQDPNRDVVEQVKQALQGTWRESERSSQRGWSVSSFRDQSRGYADFREESVTIGVLENMPSRSSWRDDDKEIAQKPKNLREWAKKYDPIQRPGS